MDSYKVRSFEEKGLFALENKINTWLSEQIINIINISYSSYSIGYIIYYTALILYK